MDATTIAVISLALSGINTFGGLGLAWWVARRDNARIRVAGAFATASGPIALMSPRMELWNVANKPLFSIDVVNVGRRPATISTAGLKLRRRGIWSILFWEWNQAKPDRLVFLTSPARLPVTLKEQEKVEFFTDAEDLKADLPRVLKTPHQLAGAYAQDVAGRQYVARLPRGIWVALAGAIRGGVNPV